MAGFARKRENLEATSHTECNAKMKTEIGVMLPQSQRISKMNSKPQEGRKEAWKRFFFTALR